MIIITKKRRTRRQYGSKRFNKKQYIDEEEMYGGRDGRKRALKRAKELRKHGNARINDKPFFDGMGFPYYKVYFQSDNKEVMKDLKDHHTVDTDLFYKRKRAYNRTFGGRDGFILYAKKKTKTDATKYKKNLSKNRYVRILPTPKRTKDYKDGFRYEIWSRTK